MSVWDAWDRDDLIGMFRSWLAEGMSASQMANQLGHGISRNAVIGKIGRLGLQMATQSTRFGPQFRTTRTFKPKMATPPKPPRAPTLPYDRAAFDIESDDQIPLSQRKSLLDLDPEHCRWPIGDPQSRDFAFCGAARVIGASYCEGHMRRAYQAPDVKSRVIEKTTTEKPVEVEMA